MANHQILDNVSHQDIKIITQLSPEYGDTDSYATLVPAELEAAQNEFPIFMRKNAEGAMELIALLGLQAQENLFLSSTGWDAHYVPLSIKRRPFLIGFQSKNGVEEPAVHIDMDSARVNTQQGESIFMAHGGQSGYLQEVSAILNSLHQGHGQSKAFIQALQDFELIEGVDIKLTLENQEQVNIKALFSVNEKALEKLSQAQLFELHQKGYLKHIYMLLASHNNLSKVIERKNKGLKPPS